MAGYPIHFLDYDLPRELIAQTPLENRSASRMLRLDRKSGAVSHGRFCDFPEALSPEDLLVINDSKVIPGRIRGRKLSGGAVEIVVLKELAGYSFEVIAEVRGGMKPGERFLLFNRFLMEVAGCEPDSPLGIVRAVAFLPGDFAGEDFSLGEMIPVSKIIRDEFLEKFYRAGEMPLPPYIRTRPGAPDRYQTIYAENRGSAAAPTAGLHFTSEILDEIVKRGAEIVRITLHVGVGTFLPIRTGDLSNHEMHAESYSVSADAAGRIAGAKRGGRRVVAVGTTAARTLETVFAPDNLDGGGLPRKTSGESSVFIYPPYEFKCVDAMLTNFHLPRSTLLAMIFAFAGREFALDAYKEAIAEKYRFYSFGDCMFIE